MRQPRNREVARRSSKPSAPPPPWVIWNRWNRFSRDLAVCLERLADDHYLVISFEDGRYGYVQFAVHSGGSLRAEAMSNQHILRQEAKLSDRAIRTLAELGWNAPTNRPPDLNDGLRHRSGSPNHFCDFDPPVDYFDVATLAVDTLRHVYGATEPGELEYHAFTDGGLYFHLLDLGITRRTL